MTGTNRPILSKSKKSFQGMFLCTGKKSIGYQFVDKNTDSILFTWSPNPWDCQWYNPDHSGNTLKIKIFCCTHWNFKYKSSKSLPKYMNTFYLHLNSSSRQLCVKRHPSSGWNLLQGLPWKIETCEKECLRKEWIFRCIFLVLFNKSLH